MSDEKNTDAIEANDSDFEGHRHAGPEKHGDTSDVHAANDDDAPDFEGHRHAGPEKHGKHAKHI